MTDDVDVTPTPEDTAPAGDAWRPDICIYHANCDDGFGSALAAKMKWPHLTFRPFNYGWNIFDRDSELMRDKNVLICDFSFPEAQLRAIPAASIVLLDHHKTAEEHLVNIPRIGLVSPSSIPELIEENGSILAHFDMEKSGAMLTWDFCYPDLPPPEMFRYLQDRDLWKFEFKETRPFSLYLRSFEYDFDIWAIILTQMNDQEDSARIMDHARMIERFYNRRISDICSTKVWKKIGTFEVPIVFCPYAFASDAAHELLQQEPTAPFAAAVVDAYGGRSYSLRSTDDREDVAKIAEQFGGGGHRNAAGFRTPL